MYLELLDNRGVDIKELAAEYLGKKLKQPKNMMYVKMMNSGKSEDIYYYDVSYKNFPHTQFNMMEGGGMGGYKKEIN